jgi:hypothetical protein
MKMTGLILGEAVIGKFLKSLRKDALNWTEIMNIIYTWG